MTVTVVGVSGFFSPLSSSAIVVVLGGGWGKWSSWLARDSHVLPAIHRGHQGAAHSQPQMEQAGNLVMRLVEISPRNLPAESPPGGFPCT